MDTSKITITVSHSDVTFLISSFLFHHHHFYILFSLPAFLAHTKLYWMPEKCFHFRFPAVAHNRQHLLLLPYWELSECVCVCELMASLFYHSLLSIQRSPSLSLHCCWIILIWYSNRFIWIKCCSVSRRSSVKGKSKRSIRPSEYHSLDFSFIHFAIFTRLSRKSFTKADGEKCMVNK